MVDPLDNLFQRLGAKPADRSLSGLEAEVGRAITARDTERRSNAPLVPFRVAIVGLSLAFGLVAGGAAAIGTVLTAETSHASASHLAPSNLLEGLE